MCIVTIISYSHSLGNCKSFIDFFQDQYDLAHIDLTTNIALFLGEEVVP